MTWLELEGVRLEATRIAGSRSGPTLVFLHEGLGAVTTWRDTPATIAAATQLPALIYARQGYGHSTVATVPRPLTYMHDEAARLPAILAAAGISETILVGHSDGASIAIIAAAHSLSPRALVLIAPHVFVEDVSVTSIARAADAYRTTNLRALLAKHHADVDGAFWGWNRAWLDPAFRAWNLESFLPDVHAPTLGVQGDADEYGTRAQVDAIASQLGAPCEVAMIAGAGHAPFRDRADEVCATISTFISRVVDQSARTIP